MYPLGFTARMGGRGQVPDRSIDERTSSGVSAKPATLQEVAGFLTFDRRLSMVISRRLMRISKIRISSKVVRGFLTKLVQWVRCRRLLRKQNQ